MKKAKIGILHPKFGRGGSEARALWAVVALKDDYEVSLITSGKVGLLQLNEYYGMDLNPKEFSIIQVPLSFCFKNTSKFAALRGRFIQRYCQRLAQNFDLLISTYNPCDFGKRAIQFIADFSFDEELRQDLVPQALGKWYHQKTFLRKIYLKACDLVSPYNLEKLGNDLVVANSKWTAELIREKYGIEARVIYPPVIGNFPDIPSKERENGFVFIGRITPEKRIETIIEILNKVRQKGYDIHLHVIGGIEERLYSQVLKELFQKNREWVFFEGWSGEKKKKEIISRHRFGLSACKNEAFGIAVAEMVKGGCIVFVPNGGGQTEIVDHPYLIYENIEDAVPTIERVLENKKIQENLILHLSSISQKFSVENFQKEVKKIVLEFLSKKL